jgi:putative acetyltransferase
MLFVHPAFHNRGIGKQLLLYAVDALNKKLVDVNEQNQKAVNFYLHFGFVVISRSEKDNMGKSYPLLHMQRAP